jgi:hypothetical protein
VVQRKISNNDVVFVNNAFVFVNIDVVLTNTDAVLTFGRHFHCFSTALTAFPHGIPCLIAWRSRRIEVTMLSAAD